jgi:hypothetical protein
MPLKFYCIEFVLLIAATITFSTSGGDIATISETRQFSSVETGIFKGSKIITDTISVSRGNDAPYMFIYRRVESGTVVNGKKIFGDSDSTGLGIRIPSISGWYLYNTFEVIADSQSITNTSAASFSVTEIPDGALVTCRWDSEYAVVELRFAILKNKDGLFTELQISPKCEIKELLLRLRCYPGQVSPVKRLGSARQVSSDSGIRASVSSFIENDKWVPSKAQRIDINTHDWNWLFYSDAIFDFAVNSLTDAPCAIVTVPGTFSKGKLLVTHYHIDTFLSVLTNNPNVRFALFEFPGTGNNDALAWLKNHSGKIQKDLAAIDFNIFPVQKSGPSYIEQEFLRKIEKIYIVLEDCNPTDVIALKNETDNLKGKSCSAGSNLSEWDELIHQADILYGKVLQFAIDSIVKNK